MNPMTVGTSWYSKALRAAFGLQGLEAGHEIAAAIQPVYDLSPGAIPFYLVPHVGGATQVIGTVNRPSCYFAREDMVPGGTTTYGGFTIPAMTPFKLSFSPSVNGGALAATDLVQVSCTALSIGCLLDYGRTTYETGWVMSDIAVTVLLSSTCGAGWQGWLNLSLYVLPTQS